MQALTRIALRSETACKETDGHQYTPDDTNDAQGVYIEILPSHEHALRWVQT